MKCHRKCAVSEEEKRTLVSLIVSPADNCMFIITCAIT